MARPTPTPDRPPSRFPRWLGTRRRRVTSGALAVLVVLAVILAVTDPFGSSTPSSASTADNEYPTSTTTVTEGPISSQTSVSATLGYAGSYTVAIPSGTAASTSPRPSRRSVRRDQGRRGRDRAHRCEGDLDTVERLDAARRRADRVSRRDLAHDGEGPARLGRTAQLPSELVRDGHDRRRGSSSTPSSDSTTPSSDSTTLEQQLVASRQHRDRQGNLAADVASGTGDTGTAAQRAERDHRIGRRDHEQLDDPHGHGQSRRRRHDLLLRVRDEPELRRDDRYRRRRLGHV